MTRALVPTDSSFGHQANVFCATFYSYKGGVGRTLALANVAIWLARRNKRVLLVDFDLEAPGLTTLEACASARNRDGIVEYVQAYLESRTAPQASDFIHSCVIDDSEGPVEEAGLTLDVMPAGMLDESYPARFAVIDWTRLYAEHNGFLLMEELRAQWSAMGYDYVLIDSRTGLTDVGGICTRQLPDATVVVFFPNEQNLAGLKQVVQEIRAEGARPSPIDLLFVASRVPRLDDEHGILRGWLSRFQEELQYREDQLVVIEQYDSLALLDQTLFVLKRPNSGLARQYGELADALATINVEDADGAIRYIKAVRERLRNARASSAKDETPLLAADAQEHLDRICEKHSDDFVVQHALAIAYTSWRELTKAGLAIDQGIASLGRTRTTAKTDPRIAGRLHQMRIRLYAELNDQDAVMLSASAILDDTSATEPMVVDAILALANADPGRIPDIEELPALKSARPERLLDLSRRLSAAPAAAKSAAAIADHALRSAKEGEISAGDAHELVTILIAGHRYDAAVLAADLMGVTSQFGRIAKTFNTAIARWGLEGAPDVSAFQSVLELSREAGPEDGSPPNFAQCLALCHAVVGNAALCREASERAQAAMASSQTRREFSCWSFLTVPAPEFVSDCAAIERFAEGKGPPPRAVGTPEQG